VADRAIIRIVRVVIKGIWKKEKRRVEKRKKDKGKRKKEKG